MKLVGLLAALAMVGLTGCMADVDESTETEADSVVSPPLSEESFVPNAINYTCAQTLSFKNKDGVTLGQLTFHTKVWATGTYKTFPSSTALFVLVQPKNGAFSGEWGYVLRSWVDQNC